MIWETLLFAFLPRDRRQDWYRSPNWLKLHIYRTDVKECYQPSLNHTQFFLSFCILYCCEHDSSTKIWNNILVQQNRKLTGQKLNNLNSFFRSFVHLCLTSSSQTFSSFNLFANKPSPIYDVNRKQVSAHISCKSNLAWMWSLIP